MIVSVFSSADQNAGSPNSRSKLLKPIHSLPRIPAYGE